jgi:hypothetical protein
MWALSTIVRFNSLGTPRWDASDFLPWGVLRTEQRQTASYGGAEDQALCNWLMWPWPLLLGWRV